MKILPRTGRLIKADIHAMLDRLEQPETVLRQAIRDMEQSLQDKQQQLTQMQQQTQQMEQDKTDYQQQLEQAEEELDFCFSSDNHTLAKTVLKRRIHLQKTQANLLKSQLQLNTHQDQLQQLVRQQQDQLAAYQQKATLFLEQKSQPRFGNPEVSLVSDEELEIAYLKELKQRSET